VNQVDVREGNAQGASVAVRFSRQLGTLASDTIRLISRKLILGAPYFLPPGTRFS
jgi:hypothetical protein